MKCNLVFVHGRSQEMKDASALKKEWLEALDSGLASAGLSLPLPAEDVHFPYYGQTLYDLVNDTPAEHVAEVIVRGAAQSSAERIFIQQVLEEVAALSSLTPKQIEAEDENRTVARGMLDHEAYLLAILRALDRNVPFASGASIALATRDVHRYLTRPGIRDRIEAGVRTALSVDTPSVVVAHSLGTVVAYNLLRREAETCGWKVPMLITLGSPLGVRAIRLRLAPIVHPVGVAAWFNARDPRDLVALHPLDTESFSIKPAIENKNDVVNDTENRHGISGYLRDPEIARRIHDALTCASEHHVPHRSDID